MLIQGKQAKLGVSLLTSKSYKNFKKRKFLSISLTKKTPGRPPTISILRKAKACWHKMPCSNCVMRNDARDRKLQTFLLSYEERRSSCRIYLVSFLWGLLTSASPCLHVHHLSLLSALPQFTSAPSHCFSAQPGYLQHIFFGWTYTKQAARDSGGLANTAKRCSLACCAYEGWSTPR